MGFRFRFRKVFGEILGILRNSRKILGRVSEKFSEISCGGARIHDTGKTRTIYRLFTQQWCRQKQIAPPVGSGFRRRTYGAAAIAGGSRLLFNFWGDPIFVVLRTFMRVGIGLACCAKYRVYHMYHMISFLFLACSIVIRQPSRVLFCFSPHGRTRAPAWVELVLLRPRSRVCVFVCCDLPQFCSFLA